ncbi:hypothetical protein [Hallella absiana]|uniref:hypothetical protein n=1 Tax=Hallella absiana TaxID=2925336 RepID=UPI0021C9C136|nr:hypothetical protein [Hallella absiana]
MKTKIYLLASAVLLLGGLTACSSSDDVDIASPVSKDAVGEALDNLTAEMQGTVYNCNVGVTRTRAKSDYINIINQIPTWPKINTEVPTNAVDITKDDSNVGNGNGVWVVPPKKKKKDLNINLYNTTLYVQGTVTMTGNWNSGTIIVKDGGELIVDWNNNTVFGNGGTLIVEKGGKLTMKKKVLQVGQYDKIYIDGDYAADEIGVQGTMYVNGDLTAKQFNTDSDNPWMNINTRLNVVGKLTATGTKKLSTDGYIRVGNGIEAGDNTIKFQNGTKLIVDCGVKAKTIDVNSNGAEIHTKYIKCVNLTHCADSKIFLGDKGLIDVDGTYEVLNNGNDAAIVMEGKDAMGVIKAATIKFNGSNPSEIFFVKTNPDEGKQRAGIDCDNIMYNKNNGNYETVDYNTLDFKNAEVQRIHDGKVIDKDGEPVDGKVTFSIPAGDCSGNGYVPNAKPDPDPVIPVVVAESHTHDISATCVQHDGNGNVYVSYHQKGEGRSGCIEVFRTTGNTTTLKQFVRDHNKSIDFNHICLDKAGKRLYAVGNNKNGGMLAFMNLKDDGTINCAAQKMGELDSTDINAKTYEPLQLVKLYQAQQSAAGNGTKKGGDGNCVIVNGDKLDVASTYGYEVYDNGLNPVRITKKEGRAKHLAYAPDGNTFYAIHYDGTHITDSLTEVGLKLEKFDKSDVNMQKPLFSVDANKVKPNNGKNAICVYDGKVYVCQSMNGLYVYDANTGAQVGHYKENIYSDKLEKDLMICANGVAVDNKYVYVAYGTRGLVVLDRNTLKKVTSFVRSRSANYVTLAGGYIYVAYGRNSLQVFKLVE